LNNLKDMVAAAERFDLSLTPAGREIEAAMLSGCEGKIELSSILDQSTGAFTATLFSQRSFVLNGRFIIYL
jgi:hypothetical protein